MSTSTVLGGEEDTRPARDAIFNVGNFRRHEISAVREEMLLEQYVVLAAAGSGRSSKQGSPAISNLILVTYAFSFLAGWE